MARFNLSVPARMGGSGQRRIPQVAGSRFRNERIVRRTLIAATSNGGGVRGKAPRGEGSSLSAASPAQPVRGVAVNTPERARHSSSYPKMGRAHVLIELKANTSIYNDNPMTFVNRIVDYGVKPADQFTANPKNARIHPQFQRDVMKDALNTIGFIAPVIENARTGYLIDGHERIMQALADNAPVPFVSVDMSEDEEAYALATFDPITSLAAYDRAQLDLLLDGVQNASNSIDRMLKELQAEWPLPIEDKPDPGAQVDKAAELQQVWQVERGDVWECGKHRLLCGDSTNAEDVARVMAGEIAAICFTSPPYNAGVSAQLSGNTSIGASGNMYRDGYDDNRPQSDYLDLLRKFTEAVFPSCKYLFCNLQMLAGNKVAFVEYLFQYRESLADIAIWHKRQAQPAAAVRVMDSHFEFILILSHNPTRAVGTKEFRGLVSNVYSSDAQHNNEFSSSHGATFPVEFPIHFIQNFTNRNDVILDPFLGSGTTLVACEQLGRQGRGIEIEPKYCAVALDRLHRMGVDVRRK